MGIDEAQAAREKRDMTCLRKPGEANLSETKHYNPRL